MGHIFISYSRRDLATVACIVGKIEDAGIRVWIDREKIKAGKTWRAQIVEAIDTCDAFVLMLSPHCVVSDNVRKEIDLAQDAGRTIFIIRLDPVAKLPAEMRYQLVGLQYIDIPTLGLDSAVNQLIESLNEYLAALKPEEQQAVRQVELVIQGVDPSTLGSAEQKQLLEFITGITATPESQLQIARVTSGSVHVFVDMPALAAFELKARALNRDRRLKRFGIKSMRLVGDQKYVHISLGILTTTATLGFLKLLWLSIPSLFSSVVGATGGKLMALTSAVVVTTAIGMSVSNTVVALLSPTPTPTATPTLTPTPQNPLVVRDALCWLAPNYQVVGSIKAGTRVELRGRGNIPGWLIVENPVAHSPCWMELGNLQIDPAYDISTLPIFSAPAPVLPPKDLRKLATLTLSLPNLPLPPLCTIVRCTPTPHHE